MLILNMYMDHKWYQYIFYGNVNDFIIFENYFLKMSLLWGVSELLYMMNNFDFFINSSSSKCNFSSFIAIHLFPFLSHVDHLWKLGEPSIPRQTGLQRPFSVAFLGCFYPAGLVIGLIAPTDGRNWGWEIDLYSTKAQEALHLPVHFAGNTIKPYTDGLVQERRNSSALAMELRLSCTDPSIACGFLRHGIPPFKIDCQMMCVLKFCFLQAKSAPDVLGHFVISHWPFYINGIILSVTIVWNYL